MISFHQVFSDSYEYDPAVQRNIGDHGISSDFVDGVAQNVETALRSRSKAELERYLRVTWCRLHVVPIDKIERHRIASELVHTASKNGPVAANRAKGALHALFVWAIRQGGVSHNPVAITAKPDTERTRDRVLRDNELRAIWHACRDDDHGRIVKILMRTGQRREEVGGMAWPELDFDKAIWSLTGERTKNARAHDVPLSRQMMELLHGIEPSEDRALLFGSGLGPFSGWSRCKRRLDLRCSVPNWRLYDLRITAVTGMAEPGISRTWISPTWRTAQRRSVQRDRCRKQGCASCRGANGSGHSPYPRRSAPSSNCLMNSPDRESFHQAGMLFDSLSSHSPRRIHMLGMQLVARLIGRSHAGEDMA